jgi:uncharacterized integral membrane protein
MVRAMRVNLSMNPYLFGCLLLLAFWALTLGIVWLRRTRSNRQEFWWGSLVCSLLGFTEPLFVPEYWDPPSVLSYRRWDAESFLFCFAIGGISAVAPEWRLWRNLFQTFDRRIWQMVRVILIPFRRLTGTDTPAIDEVILTAEELRRENALLIAIFLGSFGFTAHTGLNVIYNAALASAAMGIYIAWRRPRLRWQVWSGALLFMLIYAVVLQIVGRVYPRFYAGHWNLPALSGIWLLNAPIEEYLFAATLGAFWAPLYEAWRNGREAPSQMDRRSETRATARGARVE